MEKSSDKPSLREANESQEGSRETFRVSKSTSTTSENQSPGVRQKSSNHSPYSVPSPLPPSALVPAGGGKCVVKEVDQDDEKHLKELDYYHGYFSRDDLDSVLTSEGEYLLRIAEVEMPSNSDSKQIPRELVVSVTSPDDYQQIHSRFACKIRSLIIRKENNLFRIDQMRFATVKDLVHHYATHSSMINNIPFSLKTPIKFQPWEYANSDVTLGKPLGKGAFGEVRQGVLKTKDGKKVTVAVKMLKNSNTTDCKSKTKEMLKEARIMRNFDHKNIVKLYGIAVLEQPIYIILELIEGGNLQAYLKSTKVNSKEKLNMCIQSAQGVEYLHKKVCIHRDLAARNCLYTKDKVVKISDFGLSKMLTNYTCKSHFKLPVKWLAPETLTTYTFSVKTDVYSFGVLAYEIWSNGLDPWQGLTTQEAKKKVLNGKTLTFPSNCPEAISNFVTVNVCCMDPQRRVSMSDIIRFLDNQMMAVCSDLVEPTSSNR